jgi:hypothetical protein
MNNIRPTLGNWHFERDTAGARTDQPNMFARSRSVQVAATPVSYNILSLHFVNLFP